MADKSISELVAVSSIQASDLFVCEQNGTAKKVTGQVLENWLTSFADGHGGIQSITYAAPVSPSLTGTMTITMADTTTATVSVTNGKGISSITWSESGTSGDGQTHTGTINYNDGTSSTVTIKDGVKGDPGPSTYVWIKYSENEPTSSSDMQDQPSNWMGIYVGTSSTAPSSYLDYTWSKIKGETGAQSTVTTFSVKYQQSANGSSAPTGEWSTDIPTVSQGNYLWTQTTIAFNNGTPIVLYSSAYQGVDGEGSPSTDVPLGDVTDGAVGTSTYFARADHQHPKEALPYTLTTDGEWTVRKWDDGTAECWCSHAFYFATQTPFQAWNSTTWCYGVVLGRVTYPSGLFITRPVCTCGLQNGSNANGWLNTRNIGSSTQSPELSIQRPDTANLNAGTSVTVDYFVVGRWKS